MIEELLPDLFRIEIPLPNSPLKHLNSYVIRASERNLVIDTGLNRKECLDAMETGLREIKVDLGEDRFFHYTSPCRSFRSCRQACHRYQ